MNKRVVRSVTVISVILSFLWLAGLGWAVAEYYAEGTDPIPKKTAEEKAIDTNDFTIVALGDSLTRGTGDETGKGYVGYLIEELKKKTKQEVKLTNLSIIGQRSEQLKEQVQEQEVKRQLQAADIILITIGGNDLFRGGEGLVNLGTEDIEQIEENYLENIKVIFEQVRKTNMNATVFLIGLYNPFIDFEEGKELSKIVRHWNYQSAEISAVYSNIVFVPTFDLFELKMNDYLYTDKFHLNTEGYRLLAERVASLLTW